MLIDLNNKLSLTAAFKFPLQNAIARKEVIIGGIILLIPFVGWLLNMGHRIAMVHKMQHGMSPWPSWNNWSQLLKHGFITWLGMVFYYLPSIVLFVVAYKMNSLVLYIVSIIFFLLATISIPGFMTKYCVHFDLSEIYNPFKAFKRTITSGHNYWHAWMIAFCGLIVSFAGLLAIGIGFLFSSVWFWQVAGYSFANTMNRVK